MIRTFNCGIGFCIITPKENLNKIIKIFPRKFKPYKIGFISKNKGRLKIINSLKW